MKLTQKQLEDLVELERKATPGPWFTDSFKDDNGEHRWTIIHDGKTGYGDDTVADTNLGVFTTDADKSEEKENAELIIQLRNAAQSLLAEVVASREAMECIINRFEGNTRGQENCARAHLAKFVGSDE